jgi:hypothetical protein
MSDHLAIIARRIDRSIDQMTFAPEMWGPPECLELQALLLLEMRAVATRSSVLHGKPSGVRDAYRAFIKRSLGGEPGPFLLSALLGEATERLPALLKQFADEFDKWLPFDKHDDDEVTLELEGAPGAATISFDAVCRYYEQFHRGLQDLTQLSRSKLQRTDRRLASMATDYAVPDVSVVPRRGGAGPMVTLRLSQPSEGTRSLYDGRTELERPVESAFSKAARVARWSASSDSVADTKGLFSTENERLDVAYHSMKLVPTAGLASVRIRGKMLGNEGPIELKPDQASRMLSILEDAQQSTPFIQDGDVRAIDLDQGWFRIRYGTDTIKCWVKEKRTLIDTAHAALSNRKTIRVVGRRFDRRRGRRFVVADDATVQ